MEIAWTEHFTYRYRNQTLFIVIGSFTRSCEIHCKDKISKVIMNEKQLNFIATWLGGNAKHKADK